MPIGSGGIPYTFKISKGVGACYERNLLFFSFSNNGRFTFAAVPTPARDILTVTAKENEDTQSLKELPSAKDNLQFTMNVFDANTNRLMLTKKSNTGSVIERLNISAFKPG